MADHSQRALALKVEALTAKNAWLQEQLEIAKNVTEVARRQAAEEVEMTRRHAKELEAITRHRESAVEKNFDRLLEVADLGSEERIIAPVGAMSGDTRYGNDRCQKLGIKRLLDPSILNRILSFLDVLGEWRTFPIRKALSATSRDLANVGAHREGDLIIVSHAHVPRPMIAMWHAAQFTVNDTEHFSLAVQVTGYWSTADTFRLGVASAALPAAGEDGHKCGYWLSPKSGRLLGQDQSRHFLNKLRAECPILNPSNLLRNSKWVVHGVAGDKGKKGKGFSAKGGRAAIDREFRGIHEGRRLHSIALACRLLPGSVWILEFRKGVVEFFCADAANQPIESLGIADFCCCCGPPSPVFDAPSYSLPMEMGGYYPSILYRVSQGEERTEELHRGKGKGSFGTAAESRYFGYRGEPHSRMRGGLKHVGLEVFWAKSGTCALLGRTPAEICNGAAPLASSSVDVVCHANDLPGNNLSPNVISPTSFLLREVGLHWPYWEALPLVHDPGTADFTVAVLLEGQWCAKDRFRLGVVPLGRPLWPDRKQMKRTVRLSQGKHMPEPPQIAFGLDPLSGVWVREGMPLGYQSWPEGLCEREDREDVQSIITRDDWWGKGNNQKIWLRRNMRGVQKGKGFSKGNPLRLGSRRKCTLVPGHVWAMRYSNGDLSFYHGEGTESVKLIGVARAPQEALEENEQAYDYHDDDEPLDPQPEIPRLDRCDGGYRPVLWVQRRELLLAGHLAGWECGARLRIIRMPIVIR